MFVDEIDISVIGGHGGKGKASFYPGYRTSPDGGNGGKGGDIYFRVNNNLSHLMKFTNMRVIKGEDGKKGESNQREGLNGEDLVIDVPKGTAVIDLEKGTEVEVPYDGSPLPIVRGGWGGKGNAAYKSSTNVAPRKAQGGLPGQQKELKLIVRLIADYGLIGIPNAGKSSLLNELTNASVKTAGYAFTTLEPNLGTYNRIVLADIPGLIEGASGGKGLGIKFLKHIEKVKMLLHCISAESTNLKADYELIRRELGEFNPALLEKKEYVLLTKLDMVSPADLKKKIKELKKLNKNVLAISIHDWDALEELKKLLLA